MRESQYEGKPCRHNHLTESGKTIRYIKSNTCVDCYMKFQKTFRANSDTYKNYQAAYHKKLREEHPEKLEQYYKARVDRIYYVPVSERKKLEEQEITDMKINPELMAMDKTAKMLAADMRKHFLDEHGHLNDAATAVEGWIAVGQMDAALLERARCRKTSWPRE